MVHYSAKMNRHRQNGLSFVPKKIVTWVSREARGGLKATAGKRVTTLLSLYLQSFSLLCGFFSARVLFSLAGYARIHFSTFWTLWAEARLNFEDHIKQADCYCCFFMKINL